MLSNFGFVEDDFLHKIDLKALQKELGMSAEGIGRFLQMKNPKGVYNWSKEKSPGTRPSYNAIVRLLQKGATVETLFGVDYAATHQPAVPSEIARDSEFQEGLQAAMDAKIEAKVDAKVKAVVADMLREYGLPPRNGSV